MSLHTRQLGLDEKGGYEGGLLQLSFHRRFPHVQLSKRTEGRSGGRFGPPIGLEFKLAMVVIVSSEGDLYVIMPMTIRAHFFIFGDILVVE